MVKHESLGLFLYYQAFSTSHGINSNSVTVDTHANPEHKESIFAENGKGPQTEGSDSPPHHY